ncbi:hypothetical protein [Streptacidiphilus fuscans]|uniref:hypothetical protein n=1 Tax=Streptacidiphilus fuscans TaxID=2789292 RepID=UPI002E2A8AA6|nr:hypothetical protein [Streptacidiphilus fuscans]
MQPPTSPLTQAAELALVFEHTCQLLADSDAGLQTWNIRVAHGDRNVGRLRATRAMYWLADNLYQRMTDEESVLALVARQLMTPDDEFTSKTEDFLENAGNLLVIDHLELESPWDEPLIAAALIADVIDRLTDNYFAVIFLRPGVVPGPAGDLLAEAGVLLAAKPFSDELQITDTAFAAVGEATEKVRHRLSTGARFGSVNPWDDDAEDDDDGGDDDALTPRTTAVLALALRQLADQAWQETAALADEPLRRGAGGLFGSLPPCTLHQNDAWRRQMARAFDDLADDYTAQVTIGPRCTAEEMALHLGIRQAKTLTRNRPKLVDQTVKGLPRHPGDYDWEYCSDALFEDHDVLMLFDEQLDGIEDDENPINQSLGMANLAPKDWFTPFYPDQARDPARGFRH